MSFIQQFKDRNSFNVALSDEQDFVNANPLQGIASIWFFKPLVFLDSWVQKVELRASKQKVKTKGQVVSQQDNLLSERQAAIEKGEAENLNLRQELANLKVEQEENKKKVSFTSCVLCRVKFTFMC